MHKEKVRIAGHMRRSRVCDQCAMVSTDQTAMLLQEDLQTHMDVSRKLYAAMNEKDSEIATFKALLKMVVPNADDRRPIDELLSIVAANVDELVKGSDAVEDRLERMTADTADLKSQLAQCEVASGEVFQRRQAIETQLSMMPDFKAEVVDLEVQEDVLTRRLRGLHARIDKLHATTAASAATTLPSNAPSSASELPSFIAEERRSSPCCCCRRRRRADSGFTEPLEEPMISESAACSEVLPPLGP
jgi:chromosome segregation ATPase